MLDRTRPFGQVYRNGFPSGFVQDGAVFDAEGRPVDVPAPAPPPADTPRRRGRPPRNPVPETA